MNFTKIKFKDQHGGIKFLSFEEYETIFHAKFISKLQITNPPSKEFLIDCRTYADQNKASEAQLKSYLACLESERSAHIYIGKVNEVVGFGLFAEESINPGDVIGEYAGILSNEWKTLKEGGKFNPYLFKYPFPAKYAIDAEKSGGQLRFVNHSSDFANANRKYVLFKEILHVLFVAEKKISQDQQILIDYGPDYWSKPPQIIKP